MVGIRYVSCFPQISQKYIIYQVPISPSKHLGGRGIQICAGIWYDLHDSHDCRRRAYLLLVVGIRPSTTHLFRDGPPYLLLVEAPPTFVCSLRLSYILHRHFLFILFPSCVAVCRHHL